MNNRFQVLCVTMGQNDFDIYGNMNSNSNVVFANQADYTLYKKTNINGNSLEMYTTQTKGVGINRNIALSFATAEICLLADDDIVYRDNLEELIVGEFDEHPEADFIIFNIGTSTPEFGRFPPITKRFRRLHSIDKLPYGAPRIAFRLKEQRKENLSFSHYFGGGSLYKFGEDTIWLKQLLKKNAKIYISPVFIGDVSYENTTSLVDSPEEKIFTQGAMFRCINSKLLPLQLVLYAIIRKNKNITLLNSIKLFCNGMRSFTRLQSYQEFVEGENRKRET